MLCSVTFDELSVGSVGTGIVCALAKLTHIIQVRQQKTIRRIRVACFGFNSAQVRRCHSDAELHLGRLVLAPQKWLQSDTD